MHIGMRVRFTMKMSGRLGLVQDQKGTVVDFLWHEEDKLRFQRVLAESRPGAIFRPKYLPAGIWLEVDDFTHSPIAEDAFDFVANDGEEQQAQALQARMDREGLPVAHIISTYRHRRAQRAKTLILYSPVRQEFTWRSSTNHTVTRTGFGLTHANFLTSTASQGQTIRTGVTIDCARIEPQGRLGTKDSAWWLHLYVMFSRATCMEDMLLLRPPPRELLESGPPVSVQKALERFEAKITESVEAAAALAEELGIPVPE